MPSCRVCGDKVSSPTAKCRNCGAKPHPRPEILRPEPPGYATRAAWGERMAEAREWAYPSPEAERRDKKRGSPAPPVSKDRVYTVWSAITGRSLPGDQLEEFMKRRETGLLTEILRARGELFLRRAGWRALQPDKKLRLSDWLREARG